MLLSLHKSRCRCQGFADFLGFTLAVSILRGARVSELDVMIEDVAAAAAVAHMKGEGPNG